MDTASISEGFIFCYTKNSPIFLNPSPQKKLVKTVNILVKILIPHCVYLHHLLYSINLNASDNLQVQRNKLISAIAALHFCNTQRNAQKTHSAFQRKAQAYRLVTTYIF